MKGQTIDNILNRAVRLANKEKHEYLTAEILLFSLFQDNAVVEILKSLGCHIADIQEELLSFWKEGQGISFLSDDQIKQLAQEHFENEEVRESAAKEGVFFKPEMTITLQRIIQRAALQLHSSGKDDIYGIHLLVALLGETESYASQLLQAQDIDRLKVVELIAHQADRSLNQEENPPGTKHTSKLLDELTVDLTQLSKEKKLDPFIGREQELRRLMHILCRRHKNNPLIVGDAGVGKTSLVHGLAQAIVSGDVPRKLQDMKIYRLDQMVLLAGTKFRGEFEERLKKLTQQLEKEKKAILFIDDLHFLLGNSGGGQSDTANLLKPILTSENFRCIGSLSFESLRKFLEKDKALARRFEKVELNPTNDEETYKILNSLRSQYEQYHRVSYSSAILNKIIALGNRYLPERSQPDKSLDILDEAGTLVELSPRKSKRVTEKDVETVIASMSHIPPESLSKTEKTKVINLDKDLKAKIFGQDQAVEKVVDAILMAKSGLRKSQKPIANFLFVGPTGVGKTELAKVLAESLVIHFERFDMSEFMEKHSVSKLIGSPPGYVGFEEGGLLTEAVRKHPHCVLLLDEIEKAHQDIYNILLQVMDYGALQDAQGRSTSFQHAIVIMTSNVGMKEMEEGSIGLTKQAQGQDSKRQKKIKAAFSPEFRNRLDSVVFFQHLAEAQILQVAKKFLQELKEELATKSIALSMTEDVPKLLAERGFDNKFGARPIERVLEQQIKKKIAREMLFGELQSGGKLHLSVKNEEFELILNG